MKEVCTPVSSVLSMLAPQNSCWLCTSHLSALQKYTLCLLLAGFSLIQSTTNQIKPLQIYFDSNPCSALTINGFYFFIFLPLATQMFEFTQFENP